MKRLTACTFALLTTTTAASAAEWTDWISRDGPSGSGDWEWVSNLVSEGRIPCDAPIDIQARRISDGLDASETGEVVHMSLAGFRCIRAEQPDGACANYEARVLCPSDTDGSWSAWINQDTPGGSGDYERANTNGASGRLDCDVPTAIQTRRVSDGLDMTRTGEVYSFWPGGGTLNGFTCYTANQPDGICDDYESRFFCPSDTYAEVPSDLSVGEINMGDFTIYYVADDLQAEGDSYFVTSGFEIWFGDVYLDFDEATLQLVEVDGTLTLEGAAVSGMPTSNIPVFSVLDLMPGGGLDISLGYGSGEVLADLDAPLNPDYKFLFLSVSAGSAQFGDISVEAPGAVSATIAIAPDPVTVYMNLAGFFPQIGMVTLDEVGIGFSVADGLAWTPTTTWGFEDEMVAQTGNLWLDGTLAVGLSDIVSLDFAGEVLGDVDFDAVANGEEGLKTLAFNGNVSLSVGPDFFSISQNIADMSVLYTAENDRLIASCESADLSEGMMGAADWLELSTTAKVAVAVQSDELESLTVKGDISILGSYTLGSATIVATADEARIDGSLNLGTSTLTVTGDIYDGGFELTGSTESVAQSGFYKVKAQATLTRNGLGVSLGFAAWDFGRGTYGSWVTLNASYTAAKGWCASTAGLEACIAPGGALTLSGEVAEDIDAALKQGWSVASGAVVDAANTVINDVEDTLNDIINGVDSVVDTVVDTAGDVVDDTVDWFCGFLGC